MIDIVACSIVVGILLIIIYSLKVKELPTTRTALSMLLYGQSFTYGMTFILYGITANNIFFVENRWIMAVGGAALIWIGIENYRNDIFKK
jgi:hypothetical protein